jgi:adenylate cyclase
MRLHQSVNSFYGFIDELISSPAGQEETLKDRLLRSFEHERAVFALDMSGYSRSVREQGILAHLCKIRKMQLLVAMFIQRYEGELVRQLADNVLAVFHEPIHAVHAAVAINHAVHAAQEISGADSVLTVSVGIDHGKVLLIPHEDCFGDAVNVAFKLGEDLAGAGEIFITENVKARLGADAAFSLEEVQLLLSGVEVRAHKVLYANSAG